MIDEAALDALADYLPDEALSLFREMAALYVQSEGDRMFWTSHTFGGRSLVFEANGTRQEIRGVDKGALDDLTSCGLLHMDFTQSGDPVYRVSADGQRFYRRLMQSKGAAPSQVEDEVRRVVAGAEYAEAFPGSAHHLHEAFGLLWSGGTVDQIVSEIGDHLRKALMDATSELLGPTVDGDQEKPIERLKDYLEAADLPSREAAVVVQAVELARVVLRLDQRLSHIRDEADSGEPEAAWEETRRAAFTTAFVCYELSRLRTRT